MGNSSYSHNRVSDNQFYANVSECFCAMRNAIETCNWDKFVAHAKALTRIDVLCNKDHLGRTMLHYAAMNSDPRYVEGIVLLIKHHSKDEDSRPYLDADHHGNTPAHLALGHNNEEGAHIIIMEFPGVHYEPNKLGNTLLHLAVMRDNTHCAKLLMKHFPEMADVVNKEGKKPMDYATSEKMKRFLTRMGCSATIAIIAIAESGDREDRSMGRPRIPVVPVSTRGPVSPRSMVGPASPSRIPVVPVSPRSMVGPASPSRIPVVPVSPRSLAAPVSPSRIPVVPVSPRAMTAPVSPSRIPVVPVSPRAMTAPVSPSRIPVVPVSPRALTAPVSPSRIPATPVSPSRIPVLPTRAASTPGSIRTTLPSSQIYIPSNPNLLASPVNMTPRLPSLPNIQ